MTGIQIYNTVWLTVWLLLGVGGICGVIAGNPAHWVTIGACLYFSILLFMDKEDGESLREFTIRKYKAYKARRR